MCIWLSLRSSIAFMTRIRLGIIGAGLIWVREHERALRDVANVFNIAAICDVSAERRIAVARDYPDAMVTDDYLQLLRASDIDAVLILTPIALNAPVASAALKAGKHVIMEKPIARSQAEASALVHTARQAEKRLYVAEQSAYRPSNDTVVALLASGEVGAIVMWDCIRHYAVDPDTAHGALRYDSTTWRKEADFPLGAMFDGGIHLIAMLGSLFGQPAAVTAGGRKLRQGYGEYDHVIAFLQYANGMTGALSFSQCMPPMQSHFHIHGTNGIVVVESNRLVVQKKDLPECVVPLPEGDGRAVMWRAFAQAFQGGAEPRYTSEQAMRDVALLEATSQSIKREQRMAL